MVFVAVIILVTGLSTPAFAEESTPSLPALCYGKININNEPAPEGIEIKAVVDGDVKGSLTTDKEGEYGGPGTESKLVVEGEPDKLESKTIKFYISGNIKNHEFSKIKAGEKTYWGSGEVEKINLDAQIKIQKDNTEKPDNSGGIGRQTGRNASDKSDRSNVNFSIEKEFKTDSPVNNINIEFNNSIISSMDVNTEDKINQTTVNIEELDSKPDNTESEANGKVYKYLNIHLHDIKDENIKNVDIKFNVDRQWLQNNDAGAEQIILERYVDGEWITYKTSVVNNDQDTITLMAQIPGFSNFAISIIDNDKDASKSMTESNPSVKEGPKQNTEANKTEQNTSKKSKPESIPGFTGLFALAGLIAVVLLSRRI
jgi:PGF-pre-PGF domain-containing protein/PGF-CTERM protein